MRLKYFQRTHHLKSLHLSTTSRLKYLLSFEPNYETNKMKLVLFEIEDNFNSHSVTKSPCVKSDM